MFSAIISAPHSIGTLIIAYLSGFGASLLFLLSILGRALTPPFKLRLILQQLYIVGAQSMFVISLVALFTGAVIAVQSEYTLSNYGSTAATSSAVALSLIRELGPVLTALMFIARAGSAMTAELGIMKITEQIDALRSMSVDPLRQLMVPRVVACIISVPLLTAIFDVAGITGGYLIGTHSLGLASGTFIEHMKAAVGETDVTSGYIKSVIFGFCIAWICCFKGWRCDFGAVGVNKATTSAVVSSAVIVLVLDYFITSVLTQLFR